MTCPPQPVPEQRPLLSLAEAVYLAGLFEVGAPATRLRHLHALVIQAGPCMSDLADAVGMKALAVSNKLLKLRAS